MAFDMDDDAVDVIGEGAAESEPEVAEMDGEGLETGPNPSADLGTDVETGFASEAGGSDLLEYDQPEIAHTTSQILEVFPTEAETREITEGMIGEVRAFVEGKGYENPSAIGEVTVRPLDGSGVAGSYDSATGELVIVNHHNAELNRATAGHELMHDASFRSAYVEIDEATGHYVAHDQVGIDDIVSRYGSGGTLVSQHRENELLNEGLTESYTEEMLVESGHVQALEANERSLSYDIATDVAGELRGEFGELVDQAYFNGDVGSLRDAFDDAAGRSGTFDEVSSLLDRVGAEDLALQERIDSYDRAFELLDRAKQDYERKALL